MFAFLFCFLVFIYQRVLFEHLCIHEASNRQVWSWSVGSFFYFFYFCTSQASWSTTTAKVWFHFEAKSNEVGVRGERQSLWRCMVLVGLLLVRPSTYHQFRLLLGCFWNIHGPKTMSCCGGPVCHSDILLMHKHNLLQRKECVSARISLRPLDGCSAAHVIISLWNIHKGPVCLLLGTFLTCANVCLVHSKTRTRTQIVGT